MTGEDHPSIDTGPTLPKSTDSGDLSSTTNADAAVSLPPTPFKPAEKPDGDTPERIAEINDELGAIETTATSNPAEAADPNQAMAEKRGIGTIIRGLLTRKPDQKMMNPADRVVEIGDPNGAIELGGTRNSDGSVDYGNGVIGASRKDRNEVNHLAKKTSTTTNQDTVEPETVASSSEEKPNLTAANEPEVLPATPAQTELDTTNTAADDAIAKERASTDDAVRETRTTSEDAKREIRTAADDAAIETRTTNTITPDESVVEPETPITPKPKPARKRAPRQQKPVLSTAPAPTVETPVEPVGQADGQQPVTSEPAPSAAEDVITSPTAVKTEMPTDTDILAIEAQLRDKETEWNAVLKQPSYDVNKYKALEAELTALKLKHDEMLAKKNEVTTQPIQQQSEDNRPLTTTKSDLDTSSLAADMDIALNQSESLGNQEPRREQSPTPTQRQTDKTTDQSPIVSDTLTAEVTNAPESEAFPRYENTGNSIPVERFAGVYGPEIATAKDIVEKAKALVPRNEGESDDSYQQRILETVRGRLQTPGNYKDANDPLYLVIVNRPDLTQPHNVLMAMEYLQAERAMQLNEARINASQNSMSRQFRRDVKTEVVHAGEPSFVEGDYEHVFNKTRGTREGMPQTDIYAFTIVADRLLDVTDTSIQSGDEPKTYRQLMRDQEAILQDKASTQTQKDQAAQRLVSIRRQFYSQAIEAIRTLDQGNNTNPNQETMLPEDKVLSEMHEALKRVRSSSLEELLNQYEGVSTKLGAANKAQASDLLGTQKPFLLDFALKGADLMWRRISFNTRLEPVPTKIYYKKFVQGPQGSTQTSTKEPSSEPSGKKKGEQLASTAELTVPSVQPDSEPESSAPESAALESQEESIAPQTITETAKPGRTWEQIKQEGIGIAGRNEDAFVISRELAENEMRIEMRFGKGILLHPRQMLRQIRLRIGAEGIRQPYIQEARRLAQEHHNVYAVLDLARHAAAANVHAHQSEERASGEAKIRDIKRGEETALARPQADSAETITTGEFHDWIIKNLVIPAKDGQLTYEQMQDQLRDYVASHSTEPEIVKIFGSENSRVGELADYFATDLLSIAAEIKQCEGVSDEALMQLPVTLANARWAQFNEARITMSDRIIQRMQRHALTGGFLSPAVLGTAVSLATVGIIGGTRKGAIVAASATGAGLAVAVPLAAWKRATLLRHDMAALRREEEVSHPDAQTPSPRRETLRAYNYRMVEESALSTQLENTMAAFAQNPDQTHEDSVLDAMAQIRGRLTFSATNNVGLIKFASRYQVEQSKSHLIDVFEQARSALLEPVRQRLIAEGVPTNQLDAKLADSPEATRITSGLNTRLETLTTEFQQEVNATNKEFGGHVRRQAAREAFKTGAIGGIAAVGTQEGIALVQRGMGSNAGQTFLESVPGLSFLKSVVKVPEGTTTVVNAGQQIKDALNQTGTATILQTPNDIVTLSIDQSHVGTLVDNGKVVASNIHMASDGSLSFTGTLPTELNDQLQKAGYAIKAGKEVTIPSSIPASKSTEKFNLFGSDGVWDKGAIPDSKIHVSYISSNGSFLFDKLNNNGDVSIYTALRDPNTVSLIENATKQGRKVGLLVSIPGHGKGFIPVDANQLAHPDQLSFDFNPNDTTDYVLGLDGKPIMTVGEFSKTFINSGLPGHPGEIASEVHTDLRQIFDISDNNQYGLIQFGVLNENTPGKIGFTSLSTIKGSGQLATQMLKETTIPGTNGIGSVTDTTTITLPGNITIPGNPLPTVDAPPAIPFVLDQRYPLEPFGQTTPRSETPASQAPDAPRKATSPTAPAPDSLSAAAQAEALESTRILQEGAEVLRGSAGEHFKVKSVFPRDGVQTITLESIDGAKSETDDFAIVEAALKNPDGNWKWAESTSAPAAPTEQSIQTESLDSTMPKPERENGEYHISSNDEQLLDIMIAGALTPMGPDGKYELLVNGGVNSERQPWTAEAQAQAQTGIVELIKTEFDLKSLPPAFQNLSVSAARNWLNAAYANPQNRLWRDQLNSKGQHLNYQDFDEVSQDQQLDYNSNLSTKGDFLRFGVAVRPANAPDLLANSMRIYVNPKNWAGGFIAAEVIKLAREKGYEPNGKVYDESSSTRPLSNRQDKLLFWVETQGQQSIIIQALGEIYSQHPEFFEQKPPLLTERTEIPGVGLAAEPVQENPQKPVSYNGIREKLLAEAWAETLKMTGANEEPVWGPEINGLKRLVDKRALLIKDGLDQGTLSRPAVIDVFRASVRNISPKYHVSPNNFARNTE